MTFESHGDQIYFLCETGRVHGDGSQWPGLAAM